ncbi:MAG TPA: 3-deoxy-7-phosphoheptulonate synthase [Polyangiaceae bacterium]|nr:3-deoxy-7-phosphoheptulonate synthase [Polyangiaceae bacterium]
MFFAVDDLRIAGLRPLIPPAILIEELPLNEEHTEVVGRSRSAIGAVVQGTDDRLLVIVGPCSIHDPGAALDYAGKLLELGRTLESELCVVMRTYFEKPRTMVGWKGLINDPDLDGRFNINRGLRVARKFLRDVVSLGMPTGTEFLDPITPQFVADLVCWGAIGARTTESQVHRELASGLSMPVGFKNGTGGTVQIAVDAVASAAAPHHFLSVTKQGLAAIVATRGNPQCHVILRGGANGPNYSAEAVGKAAQALEKAGQRPSVLVDCSHANSSKKPERQPEVARAIADQIAGGSSAIFGVMLESFLVPGRQDVVPGTPLTYGQSITDGCLGWDDTRRVLDLLANAVQHRRTQR